MNDLPKRAEISLSELNKEKDTTEITYIERVLEKLRKNEKETNFKRDLFNGSKVYI